MGKRTKAGLTFRFGKFSGSRAWFVGFSSLPRVLSQ